MATGINETQKENCKYFQTVDNGNCTFEVVCELYGKLECEGCKSFDEIPVRTDCHFYKVKKNGYVYCNALKHLFCKNEECSFFKLKEKR